MVMCCIWKQQQQSVVRNGAADDGAQLLQAAYDGLPLLMGCRWVESEELLCSCGQVAPCRVFHRMGGGGEGLASAGLWGLPRIDGGSTQLNARRRGCNHVECA